MESEILNTCDVERRRLGREFHDGLGQSLAACAYLANAAREDLARKLKPSPENLPTLDLLTQLSFSIERTIRLARELARGMAPVDIPGGQLAHALRDLAAHTQTLFGISCAYSGNANPSTPDSQLALHLYRIAQEAVNNAVRHSHAKSIRIRLQIKNDRLTLLIQDDGVGFCRPPPPPHPGMGLCTMQYRADVIGAKMHIQTRIQDGTIVR